MDIAFLENVCPKSLLISNSKIIIFAVLQAFPISGTVLNFPLDFKNNFPALCIQLISRINSEIVKKIQKEYTEFPFKIQIHPQSSLLKTTRMDYGEIYLRLGILGSKNVNPSLSIVYS